jgi:predicted O-methyltransferase YrrM
MVFCDADPQEYPAYLAAALRLLRPGGVVVIDDALGSDHGPDDSAATSELRESVREDDRLVPLLLPVAHGLLAAVKRDD